MSVDRKQLTVEDLETIKQLFDSGKTQAEVSREVKRSATVVRRVQQQIKSGEFLQRVAETQAREVRENKYGKKLKLSADEKRERVVAMRDKGMGIREIANKLGTTPGSLSYFYYSYDQPKHPKPKPKQAKHKGGPGTDRARSAKRFARVMELQSQGLTHGEIAKKLGVFRTTVSYYTQKAKQQNHTQESLNGTGSPNANGNGNAINRNILIGVAFAETERFLTVLGERLGLTADVLRPKLSELLGHSPLR